MPARIVKQLGKWVESRRDPWSFTVLVQRVMDPQLWSMNRHAITTALGAGVAIAFIPLPVHTVVAVLAALYWRFNLPFFFQAEDGIRDHCVTGVQTCALPI